MSKNANRIITMKCTSTLLLTIVIVLTTLLVSAGLIAFSLSPAPQKPEVDLPQTVSPVEGNQTFGPQPLVGPLPTEGEMRIKSMELVYYADLPSMQAYLTPCYRITCEVATPSFLYGTHQCNLIMI